MSATENVYSSPLDEKSSRRSARKEQKRSREVDEDEDDAYGNELETVDESSPVNKSTAKRRLAKVKDSDSMTCSKSEIGDDSRIAVSGTSTDMDPTDDSKKKYENSD